MSQLIKPIALQKKGTIALSAPAKKISSLLYAPFEGWARGEGYQLVDLTGSPHEHPYLSGLDEKRLSDFEKACRSGSVWCVGGGYGSMRLLDKINFEALRQAPPLLVGMSDITALHLAFQKEGIVSFLGPTAVGLSGDPRNYPFAISALTGNETRISFPEGEILSGGVCEGGVTGGNLSLICALMGTKWEIETEGKILLLEDVNEEPYRIDRMLCQLQLAGKLRGVAGVILASWSGCSPVKPEASINLKETFDHYFRDAPYPVLLGFPSGHQPFQTTLPLGCRARLDLEKKELLFLESGVRPLPKDLGLSPFGV